MARSHFIYIVFVGLLFCVSFYFYDHNKSHLLVSKAFYFEKPATLSQSTGITPTFSLDPHLIVQEKHYLPLTKSPEQNLRQTVQEFFLGPLVFPHMNPFPQTTYLLSLVPMNSTVIINISGVPLDHFSQNAYRQGCQLLLKTIQANCPQYKAIQVYIQGQLPNFEPLPDSVNQVQPVDPHSFYYG